jgi:hypothetical protein
MLTHRWVEEGGRIRRRRQRIRRSGIKRKSSTCIKYRCIDCGSLKIWSPNGTTYMPGVDPDECTKDLVVALMLNRMKLRRVKK